MSRPFSHDAASDADRGPVASTSALPPGPRPLATLANLPPELKALIVLKVAEADMDEAEDDDAAPTAWVDTDDEEDEAEDDEEEADRTRGSTPRKRPFPWSSLSAGGTGPSPDSNADEGDGWADVDELELDADGNPTPAALARVRDQYTVDMADTMRPSGIEALTLLNHEFSQLALPIMWQTLDFEDRSNEAILTCIREILPHRGRHVRSLEFGQAEARMLNDEPPLAAGYGPEDPCLPLRGDHLPVVEAAEQLGGVTAGGVSSEVRHRRTRSLLLAEVVRLCPGTVRVDCEGFPRTRLDRVYERTDADLNNPDFVYLEDHAVAAVKTHLGAQLVDLTFLANDDGVTTEATVADLLFACPNLVRLELELYLPSGAGPNRTRLHDALASLIHLEAFTHSGGNFIYDEFVRREDVQWPLRVLALNECDDLSFPALHHFVHRFAPTLCCLDLDGTPHTIIEQDNERYCDRPFALPYLNTLVLATLQEAPFLLAAFASCPIRELSLGFCPAVEYKDVEAFIDLHIDTLRRIEVAADAALTEAQVESLEVLCHAKGIECELLPPGPDDDDEDEDDEDGSEWGLDEVDEVDQDVWVETDEDAGEGWPEEEDDE